MSADVPVLTTPRLNLRAHEAEDHDALARMWADPEVTRFIGGLAQPRDSSWQRLLRYRGLWAVLGYGFWAVTDRATGAYLGDAGLMDARRDLSPPLSAPETGWSFSPAAHGQGYATEAMTAVLAWSDAHLGPITQCIIDPGNAPSIRVADKLGYRLLGSRPYANAETLVFERNALERSRS